MLHIKTDIDKNEINGNTIAEAADAGFFEDLRTIIDAEIDYNHVVHSFFYLVWKKAIERDMDA